MVLFIFSNQAVVQYLTVDSQGNWNYDHKQTDVELEPGKHSAYVMTIDRGSLVKSQPSLVKSFVITSDWRTILAKVFDLPTTLLTLFILGVGIWWLRGRKKVTNE